MTTVSTSKSPAAIDARARRAARRVGMHAEKSKCRTYCFNYQGGYQLVDDRNTVIAGLNYNLSAEDVIAHCTE